MPLDTKNKIFFIHIPKTGGSSVRELLGIEKPEKPTEQRRILFGNAKEGHYSRHGAICYHHMTLKELLKKGLITEELLDEYYNIAFTRNPYTRLLSEYFFRDQPGGTFKRFVKDILFPNYKKGALHHFYFNHLVPQHEYIFLNDEPVTDFLGSYETLTDSIDILREEIAYHKGLKTQKKIPHHKKTGSFKKNMDKFYDRETLDMVNEVYEQDFSLLGYKIK